MNINIVQLEEYNNLIDSIIEDIENGKVVANPLKNQLKKAAKDIVVESTATEMGEEEMQNEQPNIEEPISIEYAKIELVEGNVLHVEDTPQGYHILEVYENAVKAAKANGVHPTTVRKYASSRKPVGEILLIYYNPGEKYV